MREIDNEEGEPIIFKTRLKKNCVFKNNSISVFQYFVNMFTFPVIKHPYIN